MRRKRATAGKRHKLKQGPGGTFLCLDCDDYIRAVQYPQGAKEVPTCPNWARDHRKYSRLAEKKRERKDEHNEKIAEWRNAVGERAGWRCEVTGAVLDPLASPMAEDSAHAHHIIPKSKCSALKYDVANGMLLSKYEHGRFHGQGWKGQSDESLVWECMFTKRAEDAAHILKVKREARK